MNSKNLIGKLGTLILFFYLIFNFTSCTYTPQGNISGQYSNEDYGFSFSGIPEGWKLIENTESDLGQNIVAVFTWETTVPDYNFSVYISDQKDPGLSDVAYLGHSGQYFYYYSFLQYPFECSYYQGSEEFEKCNSVEDVWNTIKNEVLPSFKTF